MGELKTKADARIHSVTIPGEGRDAPVRLNHNGTQLEIQRNVPTPVSEGELEALRHSQFGPQMIVELAASKKAAPAKAPAPGNGDAGGGGASSGGGSAAVTPPAGEVALPENFLDRSVKAIAADLDGLSPAQLAKARADEETGKTRSSLLALLDTALAANQEGQADA